MPNRVQLTDSTLDVISKLSAGNPGAVSVLACWLRDGQGIDPDACHPLIQMCSLDDMDIVGSRIWVLFKDVCGTDLRVFLGVLRAHQLGYLAKRDLVDAVTAGRDHVLDLAQLIDKVEAHLPRFQRAAEPVTADVEVTK